MEKGIDFRRGQVSIFVILAIVIVVGLAIFFVYRTNIFSGSIPTEISPAYDYYTSCVQSVLRDGVSIAGSHAGYLQNPDFNPGTTFAPFGSELNFLDQAVPYWYYISGNGLSLEQIPTKNQIEQQFDSYLQSQIEKCGLDSFTSNGYSISLGPASFKTTIAANKVSSRVSQKITISYAGKTFSVSGFDISLDSSFGNFYEVAKRIYDYEKKNSFLENYSTDILYTYAPVSGTEFNCSPVIWDPHQVFTKLRNALEANIQLIKISGNYYQNANSYFVVGKGSNIALKDEQVKFLYSGDWASRFEVWPTKNNLMIANPLGNQPGLSMMGFCYVPYKFVYDMYFPVMIQIYNSDASELFQFPVAVVINKNMPRESSLSDYTEPLESLCDKANALLSVSTYDINLNPLQADIQFHCLTDSCNLGKTQIDNVTNLASFKGLVPQCVNGVIIANAPGYKEKKYVISTNEESSADIILEREYKLPLEIYVDGSISQDNSVLIINQKDGNQTNVVDSISYPFTKQITLSEGDYTFDLKVFGKGSVVIPAITAKQCINVPQSGIMGLFGFNEEQCTDITTPSQTLTNLLFAGGKLNQYITPSELGNANVFRIYASSIKTPSSVEEIQSSYDTIESKSLDIQIV